MAVVLLGVANIARNSRLTAVEPEKATDIRQDASFEIYEVKDEAVREISAYNSGDSSQTDDSPCIGAWGDNICELLEQGVIVYAANFVPYKTILNVDKIGQGIVLDRLNSRYKNRVDVAMRLDEKQRAINFGVQRLSVKVLERVY